MQILVAIHLVGVVLWMGGLMTLSRILVVHAQEPPSVRPRFSHLEGRLDAFTAVPGALLTLGTGIAQILLEPSGYFPRALWLHVKLSLVVLIAAIHFVLHAKHRALARRRADAPVPRALFSALHGTIGLLLIAVLFLAVLKPMSGG